MLTISDTLRLRPYDGKHDFALAWYQDPELVYLVDGIKEPYTKEKIDRMYHYLNTHGELYFIEMKIDGQFQPVGDVTLMKEDLPIVIGVKDCQHQGLGRQVVRALMEKARTAHFDHLGVDCIYFYNLPSQKLFEGLGFKRIQTTSKGYRYRYDF